MSTAMRREVQIKGWAKAKKEALITDNHPKLKRSLQTPSP